jgi:hypothetical protein
MLAKDPIHVLKRRHRRFKDDGIVTLHYYSITQRSVCPLEKDLKNNVEKSSDNTSHLLYDIFAQSILAKIV